MSGFAEKVKSFMKKPQNRLELAVDIRGSERYEPSKKIR
jgi:hypothetical protein